MNGQPKPTRQELLMRKGLEDPCLSNRALGLLCRALTRYGPVFSWAEVQLAGTDTRIDVILGLQELEWLSGRIFKGSAHLFAERGMAPNLLTV